MLILFKVIVHNLAFIKSWISFIMSFLALSIWIWKSLNAISTEPIFTKAFLSLILLNRDGYVSQKSGMVNAQLPLWLCLRQEWLA